MVVDGKEHVGRSIGWDSQTERCCRRSPLGVNNHRVGENWIVEFGEQVVLAFLWRKKVAALVGWRR